MPIYGLEKPEGLGVARPPSLRFPKEKNLGIGSTQFLSYPSCLATDGKVAASFPKGPAVTLKPLRKKGLSRKGGLLPGCRSPTTVWKELWGFGPMADRTTLLAWAVGGEIRCLDTREKRFSRIRSLSISSQCVTGRGVPTPLPRSTTS